MATPPNVGTQILTAQLKLANMVDANIIALSNGALSVSWWPSVQAWLNINLVSQLNTIGDNSSANFQAAYSCMNYFVGQYAGGAIDPNAQNPGTVIEVITNTPGYATTIFYFTNQAPVTIANYNLIYQPIYGKTPGLTIVLETASESDWQTPATYNYATPGDPTTDLLSIVWDYPVGVGQTGYVVITGSSPVSGSPAAGGGTTPYSFTNLALVYDGTLWYLPLALPAGKNPQTVYVNGVTQGFTYDTTYSPARLYAFGPSSVSQNIVVYVL